MRGLKPILVYQHLSTSQIQVLRNNNPNCLSRQVFSTYVMGIFSRISTFGGSNRPPVEREALGSPPEGGDMMGKPHRGYYLLIPKFK